MCAPVLGTSGTYIDVILSATGSIVERPFVA